MYSCTRNSKDRYSLSKFPYGQPVDGAVVTSDDDDHVSVTIDQHEIRQPTGWMAKVEVITRACSNFWEEWGGIIVWCIYAAIIAGYAAYLAYALQYEFGNEESIRLLWMSLLGVSLAGIVVVRDFWGHWINKKIFQPVVRFCERYWLICKWYGNYI